MNLYGISLEPQQIESICKVIAHTNNGLTKTELTHLLGQCGIVAVDDGSSRNAYSYTIGLNKKDWLYNCFVTDIKTTKSQFKIFRFIEMSLNPVAYTNVSSREKYNYLLEEVNKILLLLGLEITKEGKIQKVIRATTLDEVDQRVNSLQKKLNSRAIHYEVEKYCKKDFLRKDYYDAVFEASKGLAERVRQLTGLCTDGGTLFQEAFSSKKPLLFFNHLETPSEKSEFNGLRELLESIFHLVRNPAAHTPKINWKVDETKALDILTVISFAHKYLDECYSMPNA